MCPDAGAFAGDVEDAETALEVESVCPCREAAAAAVARRGLLGEAGALRIAWPRPWPWPGKVKRAAASISVGVALATRVLSPANEDEAAE